MSGEAKVVAIFTAALVVLVALNAFYKNADDATDFITVLQTEVRQVRSSEDIVPVTSGLVKPILYSEIGPLEELPPFEEKARFIDIVLPAVLVAKYEIEQDYLYLNRLMEAEYWTAADSAFLKRLSDTYRTSDPIKLKLRLQTHPNSIVLAQAAVESGWGRSRFFKEANNLFGIWSYSANEPRVRASISRANYQVYLRKYSDISASVIDYFQTIARTRAYRKFREKRSETSDLDELLPLLSSYSERKDEYVQQLRSMIRFNEFEQYDTYSLDPSYFTTKVVEK